jgi:hypothetical protein
MKPGLCNATSGGAAGEGYAASRVYWHFANLKEAREIRDEKAHWQRET